jgi:hypothetical protein
LISAAQKVEHYEMASYGCLHEWAGLLGNTKAAGLIEEILNQEKAANEKLTELARNGSNDEALIADNKESEESENGSGNQRRGMRPAGVQRNRVSSMSH